MKPEYDSEELEKQLVEAVMDAYLNPLEDAADKNGCMQLKLLAEGFSMTPIKIRKLLVTSGKLSVRFLEIDRTADERLEQLTASFMEAENVNEALKAKDQMTSTEKAVQDKLYPVQLLRF